MDIEDTLHIKAPYREIEILKVVLYLVPRKQEEAGAGSIDSQATTTTRMGVK